MGVASTHYNVLYSSKIAHTCSHITLLDTTESEPAVTITDSTFSWDAEDSDKATLKK